MAQDKRSAIMFLKAASIILLCGLVSSQDDLACYNLFSKTDANAFLSTGKRSTPRDCCLQSQCGAQGQRCQTEQYRSYICSKKNWDCFMGQICKITLWCPGGYHRDCSDACDALGIPRCMNGGTCLTQGSTWTCTCPAGFTGAVCQTNSVPTAAPTTTTRSPEKRSDIQQIFGPSLQNAIKVGSRVVRGEDWVWGSQDGVPPGPGTVTNIGMGFQNMEVMVTWDAGRSANYRIGATGKYDLYLLA